MITEAPATRAQSLAATIERTIVDDGLRAGDALGTIDSWRATSGFARASVSEALRLLVDRGVVEIKPGRGGGVFVARTGPVVRLRHTLISVHGEATTLADAIAIREALEPLIVLDAARSRSGADVRRLRAQLVRVESARDDHDAFVRAVWVLHEQIAAVTPNEMLRAIYLTMMQVIGEHADLAVSDAERPEQADGHRARRLEVHRELVDAIEAADVERASRAVAAHADEAGA